VSWTAPTLNGGRPITLYTVSASPGGRTCTSTARSCTVTGLSNSSTYTFTVTATNNVGTGDPSDASAPVTVGTSATVPSAPTGVSASSYRSRYSVVSWTAPASNGGNAITRYTVTSSPGGFTCETETTSCTVTGLTNGVLYAFTVTATNGVGTGAPSVASSAVRPADRPDSPYEVIASARNDGSAVVLWIAGSNGGDPGVTFTVTSSPGGFTCTTSTTSCRVNGLTNGVGYRFTVTAANHAGSNYEGMGPAVDRELRAVGGGSIGPAALPSSAPTGWLSPATIWRSGWGDRGGG
jgi:hypothetical protein